MILRLHFFLKRPCVIMMMMMMIIIIIIIEEFVCRGTPSAEHKMCDYTGSNRSHRNSNKSLKEICRIHTRKTFNIFTTKDSCTWNITHKESTAVWNLKPEWWRSSLVQEEVSGRKGLWQEKTCCCCCCCCCCRCRCRRRRRRRGGGHFGPKHVAYY